MKAGIWFLLSLLASGIGCLYMTRVLLPWEHFVDVEQGRLKAQMGDLYPRWVGTRELLLRGRNPYGPEVSHEIQMAFYGHPIVQRYGEPGIDPIDEQRFVYPIYVVFLLAPTMHMDFSHLQTWAPVVFAIVTAISVLLWLDVLRYRPSKLLTAAIILFVISSPQIAQGLRLRQLGLLVAFLLVLSAWFIAHQHLAVGGVLLAISTVKPQMVVLPIAWFLFWAASRWRKRWPLLLGFGVTLSTLVALGELILPGWLGYFVDGVVAYRKYFPTTSLLYLALGSWAGGVASALALAGISMIAWRNRKAEANAPAFIYTIATVFIGTTIVLPLMTPFNQVLLLLPLLMIISDWRALPISGRYLLFVELAWPWLFSFVMLWLPLHLNSPNRTPLLPSAAVLFLPFVLLLLWMMKRPPTDILMVHPASDPSS